MSTAAASVPPGSTQRWWARSALLTAVLTVAALLVTEGAAAAAVPLLALLTTAVGLAGLWALVTRRGPLRWVGLAVAVAAPPALLAVAARYDLLPGFLVAGTLGALTVLLARRSLRPDLPPYEMPATTTPPPRRPVILMNPRSGGGKVARFGLVDLARARGADVVLIEPDGSGAEVDVASLARDAVGRGADLLGVAGGDGTQALVAGVAADHDVPFLVVSAGTRNHFALDLGLDRSDPRTCLDALTDGVELRIDLGMVGDRPFVNNASFGAYAEVVSHPGYRDDKWGTTLALLPELLAGREDVGVVVTFAGTPVADPDAVLVSNNPYGTGDIAGLGRRLRLDTGELGVVSVEVTNSREAASLLRGRSAGGLLVTTATRVEVTSETGSVALGIDGEAVELSTPLVCSIRPGALRVRVPRSRPGVIAPSPPLDWRRVVELASGRS